MSFRLVRLGASCCSHGPAGRQSSRWHVLRTAHRAVATVLLVSACVLPGCAFFSGKPALPKHASIEHVGQPVAETDFAAVVEDADIIYFPTNRTASAGRSEPAAALLEALERSGRPYAIGWDLIDAAQQPQLDELQAKPIELRENAIAQISIAGNGRAQEHCRSVLRGAGSRHLALAPPATLLAQIGAGHPLTAEEQRLLPRGFTLSADGWESYAEQHPGMNNRELTESYRVETVRRQFAAEKIVEYFRKEGGASKLLVFGNEADLGAAHGLPYYVAQKLRVRQLVLGPAAPTRAKLLTFRTRGRFEIVDRAPIAARD